MFIFVCCRDLHLPAQVVEIVPYSMRDIGPALVTHDPTVCLQPCRRYRLCVSVHGIVPRMTLDLISNNRWQRRTAVARFPTGTYASRHCKPETWTVGHGFYELRLEYRIQTDILIQGHRVTCTHLRKSRDITHPQQFHFRPDTL